MAIDPTGGHSAMDYPEHLRTYSASSATVILIVFVVVVLLFLLTPRPLRACTLVVASGPGGR